LIYLNNVASGGSTFFPNLGVRAVPAEGSALVFFPASIDGDVDYQALHTAEDADDQKWVSQIWIRQSERTPHVPSVEAL
jgi:prolyl 4-hydroxylase